MTDWRQSKVEEILLQMMMEKGWVSESETVPSEDSLIDRGILDSLILMELITFITTAYKIPIKHEDITPDTFESLAGMASFILDKSDSLS